MIATMKTILNKVSQIGFICPKDRCNREHEYCLLACKEPCEPIPLIIALMKRRKVVENRYQFSEVLNTPMQVYLDRNYSYFSAPMDNLWMTFGSGWHNVIESSIPILKEYGLENEYLIETPIEVTVPVKDGEGTTDILLRGRADLYIPKRKDLWDFKTTKAYSISMARKSKDLTKERACLQLNMYKVFHFMDAEHLFTDTLVKDHSWKIQKMDKISPTEKQEYPTIDKNEIYDMTEIALTEYVKNQKDKTTIRDCTKEETWYGRKCKGYCSVSSICPQYNNMQGGW